MDNQNNPCSCCCSLVFLAGISVILIRWDIDAFTNWKSDVSPLEGIQQSWTLVMSLILTYLWFSIPAIFFLVSCGCIKVAKVVASSLAVLFGPNLLVWNVLGCISDSITLHGYCTKKTDCDSDAMVIFLKAATWTFLYLVAALFTYVVVVEVLRMCKKCRYRRLLKNWRKNTRVGKALLDTSCSICLDYFKEGEEMETLARCKHSFHKECIDIWLKDHATCPICRREYDFEIQELE